MRADVEPGDNRKPGGHPLRGPPAYTEPGSDPQARVHTSILAPVAECLNVCSLGLFHPAFEVPASMFVMFGSNDERPPQPSPAAAARGLPDHRARPFSARRKEVALCWAAVGGKVAYCVLWAGTHSATG